MSGPTLVEFLTARLDEDEARAVAARGWQTGSRHEGQPLDWSIHMDRWSPDRVLAECEAKRRIVEAHEDERQRMDIYNRDYPLGLLTTEGDLRARLTSNARWAGLDIAARALASVYADHPGYRQEWKP